jgi:hypothetical protein
MDSKRRSLTPDESRILKVLQDKYGPQNNLDAVFFPDGGGAAIFVKDINGVIGILVSLTGTSMMQKMEGVPDDEVFERYLRGPGTRTVPKDQAQSNNEANSSSSQT